MRKSKCFTNLNEFSLSLCCTETDFHSPAPFYKKETEGLILTCPKSDGKCILKLGIGPFLPRGNLSRFCYFVILLFNGVLFGFF